MKKILIIGPIPQPTTGVSLANKVVVENLSKTGVFKIDYINTSYNKFDENLGAFSLSKLFYFLKLNLFAYKIFNSNIVYITPGQTFFGVVKYSLFILLTKVSGKELVVHIHGNHVGKEYELLRGIKKEAFKFFLNKTSKGIVLSESLTGNMSPFIQVKDIYILYNFVEDYLFPTKEIIKNKQYDSKLKIVFLSNLMEEKGIFELLEALQILEDKGIEYEAKIAGNIDDKHKIRIESYFNKLKNTTYCGVVHGEEKKKLLLWGNIFTLATYYTMEGQPISILEAMATGNIILTTNHAGIPDVFKDTINGFYVDKESTKSILDKLLYINENHEICQKIKLINFNNAQEKYKVKNFIENITYIFNQ
jgi:glycosyltransferase involved in cell wall biosynthesis